MELVDANVDGGDTLCATFQDEDGNEYEFAWCIIGLINKLAEDFGTDLKDFIVEMET